MCLWLELYLGLGGLTLEEKSLRTRFSFLLGLLLNSMLFVASGAKTTHKMLLAILVILIDVNRRMYIKE